MIKLLAIGPLPITGDRVGGTKVNFQTFVKWLQSNIEFTPYIVNTARPLLNKSTLGRRLANTTQGVRVLFNVIRHLKKVDVVMLNTSVNGLVTLLPKVNLLLKIFRKPLVVRVFGGDFDTFLHSGLSPAARERLLQQLAALPVIYLQTQSLCRRVDHLLDNVEQLSNTRDINRTSRPYPQNPTRFLFFSEVKASKGILEALEASNTLPEDCTLDIYGQLAVERSVFDNYPNAAYRGVAPPERVAEIMSDYDVLLFPSYFPGEGIPGAIVEAFQVGLPVVASDWRDISEVVQHNVNGLIVPPKDWKSVSAAMNKLIQEPQLYQSLIKGALKSGDEYRSELCFNRLKHKLSSIKVASN
ncbi:MAG: glycosyltransferase family 4 protein [Pseudomonadales bacterium]|nr:glycosyltransferase family 4 protein [Pseudomonadales bacterium]